VFCRTGLNLWISVYALGLAHRVSVDTDPFLNNTRRNASLLLNYKHRAFVSISCVVMFVIRKALVYILYKADSFFYSPGKNPGRPLCAAGCAQFHRWYFAMLLFSMVLCILLLGGGRWDRDDLMVLY